MSSLQVETMMENKKVLNAGLSDLRTSVFTELYNKSGDNKPDSIQVSKLFIFYYNFFIYTFA